MQDYVPRTVTDLQTLLYKFLDGEIQSGKRVFYRLFWTFELCVRAFPHCKPMRHIVREDNIFLISDRSKGLLAAIRRSGVSWRQRFARLESQMSSLPIDLRTWLGSIGNWQWTQNYDEGFRYGQMVTNLVEAVNFVLRRTRHLPIFAVFSVTFYRLATLMPRMGLRQAKQTKIRHVYVEGV
ncbi:hypothetical protein PVK06_047419 [Gossypium arboreum]|uniref:Uncharacterized protein n=1 Tax=Gossypium arboreum TaxID=29729 RepID=A0ABR0MD96_GOSAR|nr:hypothetical protein PVK06_047419 [Gossypium arboreum]